VGEAKDGTQAVTTAEAHMALLADELGIDPVEIRMRNFLRQDSLTHTMALVPPNMSARETLKAAAGAAGWKQAHGVWRRPVIKHKARSNIVRGVGIASGWKNVGYTLGYPEKATATVELYGKADVEHAVVRLATSEMGQGINTTIAQMAAEALGLPLEKIELVLTDTSRTRSAGSASASRMAFIAGNVLRETAERAYRAWRSEERPVVVTHTYEAPPTTDLDPETGQCNGAFAIACEDQAAEVEVDTETGHVNVLRIISANDVGKAVNPQIVEGQIQGGAIQAFGWATIENFIMRDGIVLTPNFSTYLIPTALDVPAEFEALIIEAPLEIGPWGVNGLGEMPFLSVAAAILDAVRDATGVLFDSIPLTPEKVLAGLRRVASE
jgi:CO/xanthine dehydrogenase Mo-binding subunit